MAVSALKQKVLEYIENADESKLESVLLFLENNLEPEYEFSEADMKELNRRRENYLSGKSKLIPWEESMQNIKRHRENR